MFSVLGVSVFHPIDLVMPPRKLIKYVGNIENG